mgnify:CR=1 FL=1
MTAKHAQDALRAITWPECYSHKKVTPDNAERNAQGQPFIYACALGLVNNYCLGLCMSTHANVGVNLTKVITRYFRQNVPDFKYTTVQFNKNYATKMHVHGNNEGPSHIVGFGNYSAGEVWIYDEENGKVEMEVAAQSAFASQLLALNQDADHGAERRESADPAAE